VAAVGAEAPSSSQAPCPVPPPCSPLAAAAAAAAAAEGATATPEMPGQLDRVEAASAPVAAEPTETAAATTAPLPISEAEGAPGYTPMAAAFLGAGRALLHSRVAAPFRTAATAASAAGARVAAIPGLAQTRLPPQSASWRLSRSPISRSPSSNPSKSLAAAAGGRGGGFSGGGAGGYSLTAKGGSGSGGGGGSFLAATATNRSDTTNIGNGFASIELFAATTPIPEPASWALMISGFGVVGAAMRRRKPQPA